jgi:adhesin/invasin
VDTLGNGTLNGPAGVSTLPSSAAADPGPGGLPSVLTYTLENPPSLVFGDVQLTVSSAVVEVIRFNPAGQGSPGYPASLLFYSSPSDGAGHRVNTPTPPTTFYPNVVSIPLGTVYTPGPGQPGYVAFVNTQYSFGEPACTYSLSATGVRVGAGGGAGSFTVTAPNGCPLAPVSLSGFVTVSVSGSTVSYSVAPNPTLEARSGVITVAGQSFTVEQAGAALNFAPAKLSFSSSPLTAPPAQTVSVSGFEGSFSVSVDVPWATVTSNSQQLPATLTVTVNPAGLTPGVYSGSITLNLNGSLVSYVFNYLVQALPSLVAVPAQLTFFYSGGAPPASQQLEIYSTSAVAFQAVGSSFVTATPASGNTTQKITVSVDPSGLTSGAHSGSVTVTAANVTDSPLVVPVTFNIALKGPQLGSDGVVNGASFLPGPIAPGSLFTIFGTQLAGVQLLSQGPAYGTSLGGVSMTIDGIPAPLQYVSPGQINAQVPFEVALGQQSLVLTFNGASTTVPVTIGAAAPGIFQVNGRGAILNQDSSLNSSGNPALVGSTVSVFFTGGGLVTPAATTGQPAPPSMLSMTNAATTATIGTQPATVTFSGLAPGFVGLSQANIQVPSLPTNDYPVVLTVNGMASNSGIVTVKMP